LSVALVFRIGWLLRGRSAAWIAALIYATLPAVLLNGRRAMFEGATLFAIALVIERGLVLTRHLQPSPNTRKAQVNYALLGLACGVGVATKHSLLIIVVPVLGLLALLGWSIRTLRGVVVAGIIALATFLVLNPAWWTAPLTVPREVLRLRQGVLQAQVDIFGGYTNTSDRVVALLRYPLGTAQYFEDKQNWNAWIGDQIAAYEASRLGGINWNALGLLAYAVITVGVVSLLLARQPMGLLFVGVLAFAVLSLFIATPLPWQRYYLLLAAPLAIAAGIGVDTLWEYTVKRFTAQGSASP
jgi:4-amino-4-deoxy-L-arabinose transferase-like glycosyltransferase